MSADEHMSIEEAAKLLSTALDEPFDEAEVLNLALKGRLRLSIFSPLLHKSQTSKAENTVNKGD